MFPGIHIKFPEQTPQVRLIQPRKNMEGHYCLAAIMAYLKLSGQMLEKDENNSKLVGAFKKAKVRLTNHALPKWGALGCEKHSRALGSSA